MWLCAGEHLCAMEGMALLAALRHRGDLARACVWVLTVLSLMVREGQGCLLLCLAPSQLLGQRLERFHGRVPVPGKLSAASTCSAGLP